jgi:hypothetical protein
MLDFNEDFVSVAYPKRELNLERLLADAMRAEAANRQSMEHMISRERPAQGLQAECRRHAAAS